MNEKEIINKPINILFDGPPAPVAGRFVEVVTDDGKSIDVGEWIERDDGFWSLRITSLSVKSNKPVEPTSNYCRSCGKTSDVKICKYCGYEKLRI